MGPATLAGSYTAKRATDLDTQPISVSSHLVHASDINLIRQSRSQYNHGAELTSLTQPLLSLVNGPALNERTELLN